MRILPAKEMECRQRELRILILLALIVWIKFFVVDYMVADVLNWPSFGSMKAHPVRHTLRAIAVAIPSLAAILSVIIPVSIVPAKYRSRALLMIDILFSVLVLTDVLFIRYYSDIFIFHDILLLPQTGLIAKSIWSLLKLRDVLIFADIPLIMWMLKRERIALCFEKISRKRISVSLFILFLAVSVQVFAGWRLREERPNIMSAMYDRLSVCAWVSTASFHWGDVISLTVKAFEPDNVPQRKIDELRGWFDKRIKTNKTPPARGKNLIMIQCEALQQFVVGLRINGTEVTPNLNRFAENSLYFPNAWDQTAGGLSSDSEFMANTGFFPSASGAAYTRFANNSYNSLAKALKKRGYDAFVIQGTYSAFWNCHRMHPKLYFDRQYSRNTFPDGEVIGLGLSDRTIFTEALNIFKKANGPFYGFIVTLSGHHPYNFEGLDDGSFPLPEEMKKTLLGDYITAMNYFDRELGRFLDGLRSSGLDKKSLIVLYGDHPAVPIAYKEEMEKLIGKKIEETIEWKETRRVPLIFRIPGEKTMKGTIYTDTGQMDIFPTTAGLLGVKVETCFGKDLSLDNGPDPVIFRNGSYIINGVFVEPAVKRATRIGTHELIDASEYDEITKEVDLRLSYNDIILEKNLISDILYR
ncbi:LTA synthase family protein [Synergistaceae bacterium DZ-S4]|jgi:phosphoglycerol transferase MdoB-like AlkP superfamily enzyme|uniref:LTA synthase family protein n=2 Tax=Synergistaceae TaxID=649777 RepID=UPI003AEA1903